MSDTHPEVEGFNHIIDPVCSQGGALEDNPSFYNPRFLGEDFPVPLPVTTNYTGDNTDDYVILHHPRFSVAFDMSTMAIANRNGMEVPINYAAVSCANIMPMGDSKVNPRRRGKNGSKSEKSKDTEFPGLDPTQQTPKLYYDDDDYDYGHLTKRANLKYVATAADAEVANHAMRSSDYCTNICPHHENFHNDEWGKLEKALEHTVKLAKDQKACCFTGPIIGPNPALDGMDDVKDNSLQEYRIVPDAYFKILVYRKKDDDNAPPHAFGFIVGHTKQTTLQRHNDFTGRSNPLLKPTTRPWIWKISPVPLETISHYSLAPVDFTPWLDAGIVDGFAPEVGLEQRLRKWLQI